MKKINLSSKNKKFIFIGLWILIVASLYFVYKYLNENREDETDIDDTVTPITYHTLDFDHPSTWEKESKSYDAGDIDHDVYQLTSENEDFEVKIEYRVINSYQEESGSSFYPSESFMNDYNRDSFEIIYSIGDSSLLISKIGAEKTNSDGILEATNIIIDEPNYVYQKYDDGLSLVVSAIIDSDITVPVGYKGVTISYTFRTQQAIDNWSEYKEKLREVVSSLKLN